MNLSETHEFALSGLATLLICFLQKFICVILFAEMFAISENLTNTRMDI